MSGRFAEVTERIETVHKLGAVISAMRGIAASRVQEAHQHLDSIRTYADTIGAAIGEALALLPHPEADAGTDPDGGRNVLIVFTAEQGFAGSFSEKTLAAAAPLRQASSDLFLIGDRGLFVADEQQIPVAWSTPMIAHPAQTAALATRITEQIYDRVANSRTTRVTAIHALPGGGDQMRVVIKHLVPFDYDRFPLATTRVQPRITLPPARLLEQLVEEHIFAELGEAIIQSFAAENEARMRAMIAAQDNTDASLQELIGTSRRLRQDDITEEIIELATASLM